MEKRERNERRERERKRKERREKERYDISRDERLERESNWATQRRERGQIEERGNER